MLIVYIDFRSPASYLAFEPTCALAAQLGIAIEWRPFRSRERELPQGRSEDDVSVRHARVRAAARRRIHEHYAALRGLPLVFRGDAGSTDLALGVLALSPDLGTEFVGAAFNAYWQEGADLDDPDTVHALVAERGAVASLFAIPEARDALTQAQAAAEAQGIVDTPAYQVAGQLFIGREHLPWITELLAEQVQRP